MSAQAIKAIRQRLGISQQKLADRIGVSWTSIHRWETGASTPSPMAQRLLQDLAKEAETQPPPQ